mmetsp:Transcript_37716/g.87598  ORF Transcript_37716/g.87598 Transcript_37716/m.87598 type:complete len:326 (+) Transcript_37716:75-1052(+)
MGQDLCCGPGRSTLIEGTPREVKNSAFVFVKPHAVCPPVVLLVREKLEGKGIRVLRSAEIAAEDIDSRRLIDAHYGAIASRAVLQKPTELVVQQGAKDQFLQLFGLSWDDALSQGLVFNAADAAEKLGLAPLEVSAKFDKLKKGEDQIKFGGGFYVGKVDDIYIVNGFYTRMRAKFTTPGTCIHYFEVEWEPRTLPWATFRAELVGSTNPAEAKEGSIRRTIFQQWKELGLEAEPNTGDNGVHASASPFEGLAEKANWLGLELEQDAFGKALLAAGITKATISEWTGDPAVPFEGKKQSLFDLLEDLDAKPCLEKALQIHTVSAV